ncbi:MAG: PQQ-binding-like beta-propeller repeat protein [Rickettsiales bacterium]|nr:PQQ-binding-like beta-propeller repeat protein [Rickettsiales bacterium]
MKFNLISLFLLLFLFSCSEEKSAYNVEKANQKELQVNLTDKDKFVKDFFSKLPSPSVNNFWFRNGYQPSENVYLNDLKGEYNEINIGKKAKNGFDLSSEPVIAEGKIFTLGGGGEIQARDFENPEKLYWEYLLDAKYNTSAKKNKNWRKITSMFMDADEFLGGGISYGLGLIFASSKRGEIAALDAKTGKLAWEAKLESPVRSAPIARDGKLIISTLNNKTYALDTITGETIWTHEGLAGRTNISGTPSPLIHNGKVVITYSSGEIFDLDFESGAENWSALTSSTLSNSANAIISDIVNSPLLHKSALLFITSDGRMLVLSEEDGSTIWETKNIGLVGQPWAVDNSIFVINRFGELLNFEFKTGKIIWKKLLADAEDIDDDNLVFTSPVLAADLIFIADNAGTLRAYSPKNGNLVKEYDIPEDIYLSPVIAKGRMYFISNNSDLIEMR